MAELSEASSRLGLEVDGVRLTIGDQPLDRPALVFLEDASGGHFAVLRPVGRTGTMVQVIDPPSPPWIADYERLLSAKPWTGRILVPRDAWLTRNGLPLLATAVGMLLLWTGLRHVLRLPRGERALRSPQISGS